MDLLTSPLPHQVRAADKLTPIKVGALYMEMGTGKTRTALEIIKRRADAGKLDQVLWLCPCSVRGTIRADVTKHARNVPGLRIEGIESLSGSLRLYEELIVFATAGETMLIVDESLLVKNGLAKRSKRVMEIARHCKYKLLLNGTPVSRNEADLYTQWYVLDWRILGYQSYWTFAANHLEYDKEIPGRVTRTLNVDYLTRKIAPYMYQVSKAECMQLPEKRYDTDGFRLTLEQRRHYDAVAESLFLELDDMHPSTIYRLFTALQQITSGQKVTRTAQPMLTRPFFERPEDNPRIQAFMATVDRIDDGKCLVYARYEHEIQDILRCLRARFGDDSAVMFNGSISAKRREAALENFRGPARFMVANKQCAGFGLNLQFCHNVIYYANDWDFATRAQSEDRVHRMGQAEDVLILDIYAEGTIDQQVLKSLSRKESMVKQFKQLLAAKKDQQTLRGWLDGGEADGEGLPGQVRI